MKTTVKSICAAIAAMFAVSVSAAVPSSINTFVPQVINYQGYLANPSDGKAYTDGIYDLDIRLYRSQSGGTAIWGARYSVYVKGGYFNIMLGDSNASSIPATVSATSGTTTYSPTQLWKALWNDTAYSSNYNLWLGVAPRQSATHTTLSSVTEISPRQQLLTAPYAFRTQAAEYANQSFADFTVNGNLTVSGSLVLPETYSLRGLTYSSSTMKVAGTSKLSTNPDFYAYGKYAYLYPYYDLTVAPYAGNVKFTIPSGKSFMINNNSFAVTNTTTAMKSTGVTTIEAGSTMTLKSSGALNAYPATNSFFYGQGKVSWKAPGIVTTCRPMILKTVTVQLNSGARYGQERIPVSSQTDYAIYTWSVVGVEGLTDFSGLARCFCERLDDGTWAVSLSPINIDGSQSRKYKVHVLGINRAFVDDAR